MTGKIKLEDYTFIKGQKIEIEGNILIAVLNRLAQIKELDTQEVLLLNKPDKITKDKIFWKGLKAEEFFTQQTVKGLSQIGALALDLEFTLSKVYEENIRLGRATHKDNLIKLVNEPSKTN